MKDRRYLVTYDEKIHDQYIPHYIYFDASSAKEAREKFKAWMESRKSQNPNLKYNRPIHIKVRLKKEAS